MINLIPILGRVLFTFIVIIVLTNCSPHNNLDSLTEEIDLIEDTLMLTPNESFFSPVGTLRANLKDKTSGNIYNKYENYDYIYEWKEIGDTILYGIKLMQGGSLSVSPEMKIFIDQSGSILNIYLDNQKKELLLSAEKETTYKTLEKVTFNNVTPGFHIVKLSLKSLVYPREGVGELRNVILSGSAVKGANNVMRRYRPFAVHCKWEVDNNEPIEISVHELTVINTSVNCYQPITTQFGYTGSPWSLKTNSFNGYNFSLWSYGANDPIPPFYQESHLIATGPGLTFGSYGHEGTGVKPRGEHPYLNKHNNTQIIAVRKEPGNIYDTYWSYYLDPEDQHWKLYGCGKKYNKKGTIEYLTTGAFVEVAGPATVERSGHEIRESRYRGWQMDTLDNWHPITKMIGTSRTNMESFREWSVVDGMFSMKMGGWEEVGNPAITLELITPPPLPEYLKGIYLEELYHMPSTFGDLRVAGLHDGDVTLEFDIQDPGTQPKATIFWGSKEGLTKKDGWTNSREIMISKGNNRIILEDLLQDTTYYCRIQLINDEGITWSYNTLTFKT